jgi:hypothetical protein
MQTKWIVAALVGALIVAPGFADAGPKKAKGAKGKKADSGADAEARKLLEDFVKPGADVAALSKALRPTTADLAAIFEADLAAKAETAYGPAWDAGKMVIGPKPGQTEVKLSSATSEELKSGAPASKEFPGGYAKVAGKLKPGIRVYRFKFVEPGKDLGMAFDGLVNVNGHFVIVPKPWRLIDG